VAGYHLAQLNVGLVRAPTDSPELADFMAGIGPVNAIADAEPGLVWQLQDGDGPGATALRPRGPDLMVNISVWESVSDRLGDLWRIVVVRRDLVPTGAGWHGRGDGTQRRAQLRVADAVWRVS
jgi:hypothetical protein